MAPSNLQGLNIVHTAPPPNPYLSDQDLLSVPPFPDLSAQLDLWTNLNFQSDEPLISRKDSQSEKSRGSGSNSEDDSERYNIADDDLQSTGKVAEASAHENVVTGTVIPPAPVQTPASGLPQIPQFDIGSFLAGFGIDPFHIPPVNALPQAAAVPSLAQLLSFHSAANNMRPQVTIPGAQPPAPQSAAAQSSPQTAQSSPPASPAAFPATKRARTSRASVEEAPSEPTSPISPDMDEKLPGMTAAEDKRRRNTAASARFRLKKKEREAALERKAKDLEVRVGELEKECEALRRENGWLKGLVVGVTGAGAVQHQQQQQQQPATAGVKRGREEGETGAVSQDK